MQDSKNNFAVLNDLYAEGFRIMINFIVEIITYKSTLIILPLWYTLEYKLSKAFALVTMSTFQLLEKCQLSQQVNQIFFASHWGNSFLKISTLSSGRESISYKTNITKQNCKNLRQLH